MFQQQSSPVERDKGPRRYLTFPDTPHPFFRLSCINICEVSTGQARERETVNVYSRDLQNRRILQEHSLVSIISDRLQFSIQFESTELFEVKKKLAVNSINE